LRTGERKKDEVKGRDMGKMVNQGKDYDEMHNENRLSEQTWASKGENQGKKRWGGEKV